MSVACIYKITNPNGCIYIGQTVDLQKRMGKYSNSICKGQKLLYNSIIKYGYNNHSVEVLEYLEKEMLNEREIFWIDFYKSNRHKHKNSVGLNLTDGGSSVKGFKHSIETKLKISKTLLGNSRALGHVISIESKIKMGEKNLGKHLSDSHKQKISLSNKGKEKTLTTKLKLSKSLTGKIKTEEHRKNWKKANSFRFVPINQYDKNMNLLNTFESIREGARFVNGSAGCVYQCIKNKRKSHKGFIWRLKNV